MRDGVAGVLAAPGREFYHALRGRDHQPRTIRWLKSGARKRFAPAKPLSSADFDRE